MSGAGDLHAVVRTMKALAASSIRDYERSVTALAEYDRMVSLGLGECFRQARTSPGAAAEPEPAGKPDLIEAIVFGSDQGLVGPFNNVIAENAIAALASLPGRAEV